LTNASRERPPVLMVVDGDADALERVAGELDRRYVADYRILREGSGRGALERLRSLAASGDQVALLLTDRRPGGIDGEELLCRVRDLHPGACRGLLIEWGAWGDPETAATIHRAMALGRMDYYVLKPWWSPDEYFHRTISDFLNEWSRREEGAPREATLVAPRWAPRGHELRSLLSRNGVPFVYHDAESDEGRRILERAGHRAEDGPLVLTVDGHRLVDPSNAQVARAYGVATELDGEAEFDVVVVGAGPAGLSAGVYATSEGLRTLVVERESIGGQAGSSSRIRNYLGFPRGVSGTELAQRAYQQAWVFGSRFLLMREVTGLRTEEGRHVLTVGGGPEVRAKAVVLACGVSYRRIGIAGLERLVGAGVFYGASAAEARGSAGEDVYVVGGGNSAGQAAMHLARWARRVTLVVRSDSLAESMSSYLIDEISSAENVSVRLRAEVADGGGEGRLGWLELRDARSGTTERVSAAAVFIMIGATPHTDWIPSSIRRDERGYVLTGDDAAPGALMFETTLPGVFAVGDVRHRSVKRVASAVGEGSVVISEVHRYLADREAGPGSEGREAREADRKAGREASSARSGIPT
jgi:thioredoxin reductase (NADPH)